MYKLDGYKESICVLWTLKYKVYTLSLLTISLLKGSYGKHVPLLTQTQNWIYYKDH